jgi:hypothetical protein
MGNNHSFDLHLAEFQKAADRAFAYSKREGKAYMKEQVRGVIRELFILTPPNRGSVTGIKAKKAGENTIAADVRAVFRGENLKQPEVSSFSEMSKVMKASRRPGSIRATPKKIRVKAPSALIAQYIKKKQKKVGYLASAWAMAAIKVGSVRVPGWIKRHSAPGSSTIKEVPDGISASITNAVEWADTVYGLRARINAALRKQTRKINNKTRDFYKKIGREF